MRRRAVLAVSLALGALPAAAFAQQRSARTYRIGFLGISFASGYTGEVEWIREGLRTYGYVEGANFTVDWRWAEGNPERMKAIADEFVAQKVDLILTHALPGALAAARATSTIPIVTADSADPVAAGLAASLARPGGNVTGSTGFVAEETAKRLQLLTEAVPRLTRAAFLVSTVPPATAVAATRRSLEAAAAELKLELQEFLVREATELPEAFNAMVQARCNGVVVNIEPLLNSQANVVAALASVKRLPAVGFVSFADAGGLLAYGANRRVLYNRAAYFIDRILKGANPGEIPFERAAKFDLIVNVKTAKAIGVSIPRSMLLHADRVIE